MKTIKKYAFPIILIVLIIITFIQFNYLNSRINLIQKNITLPEILAKKIETINDEPEIFLPIINQEINKRESKLNCFGITELSKNNLSLIDYVNLGDSPPLSEIAKIGEDALKSLGYNWKYGAQYNYLYHGIQCNYENGWVLVSGDTTELDLILQDDLSIKHRKPPMIFDNGMYVSKGNLTVLCCKVV